MTNKGALCDDHITCHVSRAVGSKLSVTIVEEFSRKSRDAQQELRRYMREVRKNSPEKLCRIQYDKLLVDDKVFIFRCDFVWKKNLPSFMLSLPQ